jgi:hypothetical protein
VGRAKQLGGGVARLGAERERARGGHWRVVKLGRQSAARRELRELAWRPGSARLRRRGWALSERGVTKGTSRGIWALEPGAGEEREPARCVGGANRTRRTGTSGGGLVGAVESGHAVAVAEEWRCAVLVVVGWWR